MSDQNQIPKIMIVDDDNFLLDMYAMKFKNSNFDVTTCISGLDCIEKFKNGFMTDILVFDLIMPKMDGIALIKEIKNQNYIPNATKVILTNQGQAEDLEKVSDIGVDGYIVKALHTPSEVVEKVKEIYNKKK